MLSKTINWLVEKKNESLTTCKTQSLQSLGVFWCVCGGGDVKRDGNREREREILIMFFCHVYADL